MACLGLQALTCGIQKPPASTDHRALSLTLTPACTAREYREATEARTPEASGAAPMSTLATSVVAPALASTAPQLSRHISSRLRSQAAASILGNEDATSLGSSQPMLGHTTAPSSSHLRTYQQNSLAATARTSDYTSMPHLANKEHLGAMPGKSYRSRPHTRDAKHVLEASMTDLAQSSRAARFASENTLQPAPFSAVRQVATEQQCEAGRLRDPISLENADLSTAGGRGTIHQGATPTDKRLQEIEQRRVCRTLAACTAPCPPLLPLHSFFSSTLEACLLNTSNSEACVAI
jgi:hypothetical protein